MILTCPACATRYLADDASIGPSGRMVRCASCGHTWHQAPPIEPAVDPDEGFDMPIDAADAAAAATAAEETAPAAEAEEGSGAGVVLGWVLLLALTAAVLSGAYVFRDRIVEAVPQTERLYALVGLSPNPTGLELLSPYFERSMKNGEPVLTVFGEVVNVSTRTVTVPPIRVSLRDAANAEVFAWTKTLDQPELVPGATASFATSIANPPLEAVDVRIEITRPDAK
ncbi:DUF3426 domain-containing protein [Futiania mangrovi]|uniref:Zinc-ribbon domain-containing protein n=1 Tax=Futiania mangrovi TaxID=2959716 RepID=A0A9J6PCM5_9PROT|nr:DUF3426 domain-containing protein [Futiania mangrovii]MCP1336321.1 zinc-ribbon domain-containing protein [Futiania mangrovii]